MRHIFQYSTYHLYSRVFLLALGIFFFSGCAVFQNTSTLPSPNPSISQGNTVENKFQKQLKSELSLFLKTQNSEYSFQDFSISPFLEQVYTQIKNNSGGKTDTKIISPTALKKIKGENNILLYSIDPFNTNNGSNCILYGVSYCINIVLDTTKKQILFTDIEQKSLGSAIGFDSQNNIAYFYEMAGEGVACQSGIQQVIHAVFLETHEIITKKIIKQKICKDCVPDTSDTLICKNNDYTINLDITYSQNGKTIPETKSIKEIFTFITPFLPSTE